ncbi:MaoC family dehydratase [Nitrosopumilus sp.]|uniref:MaoC family dehydratase n=1 Tax=Nitrosopumilus sp. TaxID=2024843 RepID=UPI00349FDEF3
MIDTPNTLTFKEVEVGHSKKFTLKIDLKMLNDFADLSGDYNPLHMSNEYAEKTQFKKPVCHGMLLASFFSRLVGMYIPGKNSLYFSQTLNFRSPCFVNDIVSIHGKVIEKHNVTKMITIKTEIHNQDSVCIVDGIAKVIVRE